jgi:uroporphyrinogen III methyltransferase/synthase
VPEEYVAERVVDALEPNVSPGDRILLPRAAEARPELPEGLRVMGAEVDEVSLYRSVVPGEAPSEELEALREGRIDVVTFTSSSTVRNLVSMLNGDTTALKNAVIACIGPITAATAEELGLPPDVVAKEYTVPGLVAGLKEHMLSHAD